jgi:DNA-binding NtrC family response regulator
MKQHLLIVDDEEPIRTLLSEYLKKHGYETSVAESAKETLEAVASKSLDLVILDIALPDADGLELLARIKTSHPNLHVIILTGMGFDDELLAEALRRKASGYVSKTLPLDQLLMEIRRILKVP